MERDEGLLEKAEENVTKYYIGVAAMRVVEILQNNCISDTTRYLVCKDGYNNAYAAIVHQFTFGCKESIDAIVSDIRFMANMQYILLPDGAQALMEYACSDPEEYRNYFCNAVFEKALSLIKYDKNTANKEAERQLAYAELPF